MQLITDELIKSLCLREGAESIKADVDLLEAFVSHANGCGLESLDTPSGKLIESGLAVRYSDHFVQGSGLEGISGLIATLKKGLEGIKKLARGKGKAAIIKSAEPLTKEIDKTYTNNLWWGNKQVKETPPTTNGLAKLIGDFSDFASLKSALTTAQKTMTDAYTASTKQTEAYSAVVDKIVVKIGKMKGKSSEEMTAFANGAIEELKKLKDAMNDDLPEIKAGSSTELPAMTTEDGKSLGELMKGLLSWGVDIEMEAEDNRIEYGAGQDTFDDNEEAGDNDAMSKLQWNYLYWEATTEANSNLAEKIYKWSLQVAQAIEVVINSAVK